jgi:hypothetical protein
MGTVKQAVEALGTYGGEPRPRTSQTARFLQNARLLPINEGKWVKHVSATHLATLILAVAATPKPLDATRAALTWGSMTPGGKPLDREWDDPNRQRLVLAEELTGCIKLVWQEAGQGPMTDIVAQSFFDITTNRPHAIVTLDDKRTEYLPLGAEPDLAEFPGFHRVCRIPGTVIRSVAVALYEGPQHYALLARQPDIKRNPYRDPASVLSAPLAR